MKIFAHYHIEFFGIVGMATKGNSNDDIVDEERDIPGGIGLKEVVRGFAFLTFPLTNPECVGDLRRDRKTSNLC